MVVSPFDPKDIEKECFGGVDNGEGGRVGGGRVRNNNAYLLVYESVGFNEKHVKHQALQRKEEEKEEEEEGGG